MIHFTVADHGSICLLEPVSDQAQAWLQEYVDAELHWGNAIVVEPRYLADLIDDIEADFGPGSIN